MSKDKTLGQWKNWESTPSFRLKKECCKPRIWCTCSKTINSSFLTLMKSLKLSQDGKCTLLLSCYLRIKKLRSRKAQFSSKKKFWILSVSKRWYSAILLGRTPKTTGQMLMMLLICWEKQPKLLELTLKPHLFGLRSRKAEMSITGIRVC